MDAFIEQLVKKKRTPADTAKTILIIIMTGLIPVFLGSIAFYADFAYFIYIAFFALLILIYTAWYLISSQYIEYEYAVTNSNLTVDKVIAKRRRKKILSIEIRELENLAKLNSEVFQDKNKKCIKYYTAARDVNDSDTYCAFFNSAVLGGMCTLIFSPDSKIINAMRPYLKRDILKNLE